MAKRKKSERIAIKRACQYSNTKDDPINIEETDDFVEPIQKKTEGTSKVNPKKSKESGKKNPAVEETDDFVESVQKKTGNRVIQKKRKEAEKKNITITVPFADNDEVEEGMLLRDIAEKSKKRKLISEKNQKGKQKKTKLSREDKEKGKGKAVKPVNKTKLFGIRARTSPHTLYETVQKLSRKQRTMVREMGFGKLLKLNVEKINAKIGHYVVDCFNPKKMAIILSDEKQIPVTKEDVKKLFGIPSEGIKICEVEKSDDMPLLSHWKARYTDIYQISPAEIAKKIIENEYEEEIMFKVDFLMLFTSTMIESTLNGRRLNKSMNWVQNERNFGEYDWCNYITDALKTCKKNWKPNDHSKYFVRPLTFLVLLYLDRVTCEGMDEERTRPPIVYWTGSKQEDRETRECLNGGFGLGSLRDLYVDESNYDVESEEEVEFDDGSVEKQVAKLEGLCEVNLHEKIKLEEEIRNFKRKFPDNIKVLSIIEKYKQIYMCCVNFDVHEGEGSMVNQGLIEGDGNMGNMEEDEDSDNVHQEGDVEVGHTNSINFYETQDKAWIDAAIEVADAIQDISNEKDVADAIQNASRHPDFTDEIPSFKLLSQDSQEKEVCENFKRSKRETKLSEYDKSSWLERAVNVMKGLIKEEKMVWNYVLEGAVDYGEANEGKKDKSQLVEDEKKLTKKGKAAQEKKEETPVKRTMEISAYETRFGFKCMHYSFSELTPSTPVGSALIDAWATVLNFEEAKRSKSSPYRLFGYIGLFPHPELYGILHDKESRLENFKTGLRRVLEEKNEKMTLKDYELIVFPVVEKSQYYLVSFDFKNPAINVIDNMDPDETVVTCDDHEEFYKKSIPVQVKEIFVDYLKEIDHPRMIDIEKLMPERLHIDWATSGNIVDTGVFTMRHMETWMGKTDVKWDCGLSIDRKKIKAKIAVLRRKYASAILSSESNILRGRILKEANELASQQKE